MMASCTRYWGASHRAIQDHGRTIPRLFAIIAVDSATNRPTARRRKSHRKKSIKLCVPTLRTWLVTNAFNASTAGKKAIMLTIVLRNLYAQRLIHLVRTSPP